VTDTRRLCDFEFEIAVRSVTSRAITRRERTVTGVELEFVASSVATYYYQISSY
jgi:hypothetical protein